MPKVKKYINPYQQIVATVDYFAALNGMTRAEVYNRAMIQKGTMYNRIKEPESYTLGELTRLSKVIGKSILELLGG